MSVILVIGKDGQVGFELARSLGSCGNVIPVGRDRVDLADPDSIRRVMRDVRPDLIVNAAAYTAVDRAEAEPDLATAVNGLAPGVLAEEAKRLNAVLVHYSTDYVFDGTKGSPYSEEDATRPINAYGRSKLAGEHAIQETDVPHLILRTSWVYGRRGRNFMLTMLRLAKERQPIRVVNDQWGTPTSSASIAEMTAAILRRLCLGRPEFGERIQESSGVYHLSCAGQTTWFGFASRIFENAVNARVVMPEFLLDALPALTPISTDEFPVRTPRPRNTVLRSGKLFRVFRLQMPHWESSLSDCMADPGKIPAKHGLGLD